MSESISHLPLKKGDVLYGLKQSEQLQGIDYWDQVVSSPLGELIYAEEQSRDGFIRWETKDGAYTVAVESDNNIVVSVTQNKK